MKNDPDRLEARHPMPSQEAELLNEIGQLGRALSKAAKVAQTAAGGRPDWTDVADLGLLRDKARSIAELSNRLGSLHADWTQRADQRFLELESDLRDACSSHGWHVDGQWPTLYVERALSIAIDDKKKSVSVAGRRVTQSRVASVIAALEPLVRELLPHTFSSERFINDVAGAYDEARSDSTQVPILAVYRKLIIRIQSPVFWKDARDETFTSLTLDQFRARLYRALEEGVTTSADGRDLRLLPPLDTKDSLFLYQPAEARFGYVGRIEFLSAKSDAR